MTKYTWSARNDDNTIWLRGDGESYRDRKAWRATIIKINEMAKELGIDKGTKLRTTLIWKGRKMVRTVEIGKDWTKE